MTNQLDPRALVDGLVKNAVDFLARSVSDFDGSPKHSLIGFTTAVELFLKARLVAEHWALVLERPESAKLPAFLQGNQRSVSMEKLPVRLEDITGHSLPQAAKIAFEQVRTQRNKLVHFFDPTYDSSATTRADVARQQCVAWHHLHGLLSGPWATQFQAVKGDILLAENLMRRLKRYLAERYTQLKPDIDNDKAQGATYWTCPSCEFDALREQAVLGAYREHNCKVCSILPRSYSLSCPDCGTNIVYWGEGDVTCPNNACGRTISFSDVADTLQPAYTGGRHKRYVETLIEPAVCDECEEASVLPFQQGHLCTNCLKFHDSTYHCDYCGALCTGNGEDSGWAGCLVCGGRRADLKND